MANDERPEAVHSKSQHSQHKPKKTTFRWLSRALRGSTYISYTELANRTASAFDFGDDGYAATVNYGGELLQISAPSRDRGILFARGDFEYSLYASLARGQRSPGGKSAFGLKLSSGSTKQRAGSAVVPTQGEGRRAEPTRRPTLKLGKMLERGSFNYRWPVNEHVLRLEDTDELGHGSSHHADNQPQDSADDVGTCSLVSYSGGGFIYQLLHVELNEEKLDRVKDFRLALKVGGRINFKGLIELEAAGDAAQSEDKRESTPTTAVVCLPGDQNVSLESRIFLIPAEGNPRPIDLVKLDTPSSPLVIEPGDSKDTSGVYEASIPLGDLGRDRHITCVAVFSLHDHGNTSPWPANANDLILSPERVFDHLGLCRECDMATGTMWETAFLEKDEQSYVVSELSEVSLVGRCLEKTLQVDMVPATFTRDGMPEKDGPMAMVSNLFLAANVDLKSMFWKLRFLIKVRGILLYVQSLSNGGLCSGDDWEEEETIMLRVAKAQVARVDKAVERLVLYLARAMLDPENGEDVQTSAKRLKLLPDSFIISESNYYYVMVSLWYVVKNYPEHPLTGERKPGDFPEISSSLKTLLAECYLQGSPSGKEPARAPAQARGPSRQKRGLLASSKCLPAEDWVFERTIKAKTAILKWYHYASVMGLSNAGILPPRMVLAGAGILPLRVCEPSTSDTEFLEVFVERLKRKAKIAFATKISTQPIYSETEEIVDRLAFIAFELGVESHSPIKHKNAAPGAPTTARRICISDLATKRILQRDYSRELHPGLLPCGQEGPTSGPWEIHALCHHSRLMVANAGYKVDLDDMQEEERARIRAEVEMYRGKFSKFLTSDATLVPCWERTNLVARRGWLRSEASSVLASTLIEICLKDLKHTFDERPRPNRRQSQPMVVPAVSTDGAPAHETAPDPYAEAHMQRRRKSMMERANGGLNSAAADATLVREFMKRKINEMDKGQDSPHPPLDWRIYSPPPRYHPEEFFSSLEDTPELYCPENMAKVQLPMGLVEYFGLGPARGDGASDAPAKAQNPSLEDFSTWIKDACNLHNVSVVDLLSTSFGVGPSKVKGVKFGGRLAGSAPTKSVIDALRNMLIDSLVDLEVQHRLIALTSIPNTSIPNAVGERSKVQLQLLAYVLHAESAVCLNSHVLRMSEFSCQKRDAWCARITLRSWSRRPRDQTPPTVPVGTSEDDPICLPEHLFKAALKSNSEAYKIGESDCVNLEVSSVVLSSNAFGDFSKCSVVSRIIPLPELRTLGEDARKLWERFTHQPQTGRCLVFLMILGVLCQEIAKDSQNAMEYFTKILNLEEIFIRTRGDSGDFRTRGGSGDDDDRLKQLQLELWCLESLYKLRNTLVASMARIQEARVDLVAQIQDGPGRRSDALERMCQESLELFDRRVSELAAVNGRLERKVELNTRYRDALSTMFALTDSQNSLKQNEMANKQNFQSISQNKTIEKLTYLTIIYLPMSLTAALFAIPSDQGVTPDGMGSYWFAGIILLALFLTFALVLLIEPVKGLWDQVADKPVHKNPRLDDSDQDPPASDPSFRKTPAPESAAPPAAAPAPPRNHDTGTVNGLCVTTSAVSPKTLTPSHRAQFRASLHADDIAAAAPAPQRLGAGPPWPRSLPGVVGWWRRRLHRERKPMADDSA